MTLHRRLMKDEQTDRSICASAKSRLSPPEPDLVPAQSGVPARRLLLVRALAAIWIFASFIPSAPAAPASNVSLTTPLSLTDAINVALRQNPAIRKAQKDSEAAQGIVIQTRAIAMPKVRFAGNYSALEPSDVDKPPVVIPAFTFGTDQSWSTQIHLVQSLYEGGRIVSSFRAAKLLEEQALLNYRTAVADTVLAVQIAYYDILLAAQQIAVQEASLELLNRELADTTRRYQAGTVPRFNVLRAEVELANARPKLIRARNSLRIANANLANLLGFKAPGETDQDAAPTLSGKLEAEPFQIELPRALTLAARQRTELASLRAAESLRKEDLASAKAGYKPSVQAFGGYDAHSSLFHSDLTREVHGWIAGVQLSWDIFDGLRTRGRVKETTALYERAGIELEDAGRRIDLEVRTAHSNFIEANEVLKSQEKAVEQAEETLRLATARGDAGTVTQLDVLSAQTALTEARTTQIQALHDYSLARARLQRAMGAQWSVYE